MDRHDELNEVRKIYGNPVRFDEDYPHLTGEEKLNDLLKDNKNAWAKYYGMFSEDDRNNGYKEDNGYLAERLVKGLNLPNKHSFITDAKLKDILNYTKTQGNEYHNTGVDDSQKWNGDKYGVTDENYDDYLEKKNNNKWKIKQDADDLWRKQ